MKRLSFPVAASCLLALSISNAMAAPYSALYVFGDSLSDAGQFPDAGGPANATTRFTNRVGPTYLSGAGENFSSTSLMILGEQLGLGPQTPSTSSVFASNGWADGNNWATGGYTTEQIYDSITAVGGSIVQQGATVYRQRDGFLVDLANRGQSLDSSALYYVNGGGNDFLQGTIFNPAMGGAAGTATRLVQSVDALQQAGARYIMVSLLPDLGSTPFTGGSSALISGLVADVNTSLISQLRGINAEIIPLNTTLLVDEVLANPAAYGLDAGSNPAQTLTNSCFNGCSNVNTTYGVGGTSPDPSKLLFNDGVHPTAAGQQAVADYATSLLAAPWEISLLPEMAYGTLRGYEDQVRTQWQADANAWQSVDQWRSFVSAAGQHIDIDGQDAGASADGNGYSLSLGGSYRLNDAWRAGVAMGAYQQELDAGSANSNYKLDSYLVSAFAQYQENRWWADIALTGGYLDYRDLQRKMDIGAETRTEKGDTDGELWSLSSRVGYDIAQPGSQWHLSPFLSGEYARVTVDGYSEDDARSTALNYDDQVRKSKLFGVGLQGSYELSPQTRVFAEVVRERQYKDDASDVTMELNSVSGLDYTLEGYTPDDDQTQLSVGLNHKLAPELALRGGYSYMHSDSIDQQAVSVALVLDF